MGRAAARARVRARFLPNKIARYQVPHASGGTLKADTTFRATHAVFLVDPVNFFPRFALLRATPEEPHA